MHTNEVQIDDFDRSLHDAIVQSRLLLTESKPGRLTFQEFLEQVNNPLEAPPRKRLPSGAWSRLNKFIEKRGGHVDYLTRSPDGLILYVVSGFQNAMNGDESLSRISNVFDDQIKELAAQTGITHEGMEPPFTTDIASH